MQINKYFRALAENHPYAKPEFEASTKVLSIITSGDLSKKDFDEIVRVYSQVTEQPHFNGSGWHDFQIRIMYLIYECGFEAFHDGEKIGITEKR